MTMQTLFETLYAIDRWIFYAVNRGWGDAFGSPILDAMFTFLTTIEYLYIPVAVILVTLCIGRSPFGTAWSKTEQWRGRWCTIALISFILVADPLNARYIKEIVKRPRPCQTLSEVRQVFPCGGGKSFPSGHAVNSFGAAMIIGLFYTRLRAGMFVWASLVALSRVYGGVHYVSDISAGAVFGSVIAFSMVHLLLRMTTGTAYSWQGEE
jgi:membrane-associated phospholipid phosphatase